MTFDYDAMPIGSGCHKVLYKERFPNIEEINEVAKKDGGLIRLFLAYKHVEWEYDNEYRLAFESSETDSRKVEYRFLKR